MFESFTNKLNAPVRNIGTPDRILRLVIASLLFIYAYVYGSWLSTAIGLFVLYEALAGWCALYQLIGKNSCPIPPPSDDEQPKNEP